MDQRNKAVEIFLTGVESVKPDRLINRYISIHSNSLKINELTFDLSTINSIYVIGAGKASAAMANALEFILGSRITGGHIITKYGHSLPLKFMDITEAGHPVPDENGTAGTDQVLKIVKKAGKDDLVICLISGGGSALLADVPDGCTLEDLSILTRSLLKAGADIIEINCIRKHLSKVKGGLLSRAAYPARLVSLILSDVIGDPPDAIASGPTAPDPTTFSDAISVIGKYKIEEDIPSRLYRVLQEGAGGKRQETLKESDEILRRTSNLIIGTNILALETAKAKAESFGYESQIVTNTLEGDVADVAEYIIEKAKSIKTGNNHQKYCLLFGGEPTVKVRGDGLGGRNQHLALIIADLIRELPGMTILSGATDGTDGPTDAAGAVVDCHTSENAKVRGLNMEEYINHFNSNSFFIQEGGLIKTGPTQTNVMDLMVTLVE